MKKQLWVVAGGNGSGKSTFYHLYLKSQCPIFVNADEIASAKFKVQNAKTSEEARLAAAAECERLLGQGASFCFETVFSHTSKVELIERAKILGYEVTLIFIHLQFAELNEARVMQRVKLNGHSVPREKIYSRIPRTLDNMRLALKLVDAAYFLDNSSAEEPFRQIAHYEQRQLTLKVEYSPAWLKPLLEDFT